MLNFTHDIPTKIYFGEGQIKHLSDLAKYGSKVLMVYGGGSIKRLGIYDTAMELLTGAGLTVFELPGVEPNPRIGTVRKGVELCKANGIDMVLAIGGGSTCDCSKVVAAGALYEGDAWDLVVNPRLISKALPIFTVPTLAATGSEMDKIAVISNPETCDKIGTRAPALGPVMSIMDPVYTYSTPKKQTAAGTADMISHIFENYFTPNRGAALQRHLCEALLKTAFTYGPIALEEPENYEARANLFWTSSLAINGQVSNGSAVGWTCHPIEHELSAFHDIVHGEGLAVVTPAWMRLVMKKVPETIADFAGYGRAVWNLTGEDAEVAEAAVKKTEEFFFDVMGLPRTLSACGIPSRENFEVMAEKSSAGTAHSYVPLTKEDVLEIFNTCY